MSITFIIIAVTSIISFRGWKKRELLYRRMFNAYDVVHNKQYSRLITHAFLHADTSHLIFNMLTLYFFGRIVETYFRYIFGGAFANGWGGTVLYLLLYLSGAVVSTLPDLYKHRNNPDYYALGASGAISAVLFSAIMFEPAMKIYIFFIPIGIPAVLFAPLYLIYCQWMARRNRDNVGHSAHFWGAVYGIVFTIALYPDVIEGFVSVLTKFAL